MENKETPFLDFYKTCMKSGVLISGYERTAINGGLCGYFGKNETLELFRPTEEDFLQYQINIAYWGCERATEKSFSKLRQTIVLFCAAINNELK